MLTLKLKLNPKNKKFTPEDISNLLEDHLNRAPYDQFVLIEVPVLKGYKEKPVEMGHVLTQLFGEALHRGYCLVSWQRRKHKDTVLYISRSNISKFLPKTKNAHKKP